MWILVKSIIIYFFIFISSKLLQSVSMYSSIHSCIIVSCYFCWKVLGLTWVEIDFLVQSRDNGSFLLKILTTQKTVLRVYKLDYPIANVGIEIKQTWSPSTFFMYLMLLLWYARRCLWSSQCTRLSIYYLNKWTVVLRVFSNSLPLITIGTI